MPITKFLIYGKTSDAGRTIMTGKLKFCIAKMSANIGFREPGVGNVSKEFPIKGFLEIDVPDGPFLTKIRELINKPIVLTIINNQ